MHLAITFRRATEFDRDVAHYGVAPETLRRIEEELRANPLRGLPGADPLVRDWDTDGLRLSYALLEAQERIWLLRLVPQPEPKPRLLASAREAIRLINDLKRLVLGW